MAKKPKGQPVSAATTTEPTNGNASDFVSHDDDPLLTFTEAAELIGRSSSTIRNWVNDGLILAHKDPSGLRRVRKSEFVKFYGATALAKLAEERQERINRAVSDREEWRREIERDGKAFERKQKAKATEEE